MCSFQVLFLKWVLTMFDMIDAKDQLRAIYGFIFNFITNENLVFLLMTTILSDSYCYYYYLFIVVACWMTLPHVRPTYYCLLMCLKVACIICFFFQCPFICHLLYLLTRKENGRTYIPIWHKLPWICLTWYLWALVTFPLFFHCSASLPNQEASGATG